MKKLLIASAVATAFAVPGVVFAQAAAPAAAPASPHTFTANVGLVTDYRFRSISQTFNGPAIQDLWMMLSGDRDQRQAVCPVCR